MKPLNLLACFLLISAFASAQPHSHKKTAKSGVSAKAPVDSAAAIHQSALIIDTHADTPQRFLDENFDLGQNTPVADGHIDLGKIKQGNLGAEFFSIWVEPEFKGRYSRRAMDLIDSVYQQAARHPDKVMMAFTADDIV
ncbi:MAG TPA: membrane dipeptidase, partial [Candidatus Sulfotelmatobacter sp.]|nr:membrane dipeptidase [Candidatus Sulfotelmatobacter sp.]